MKKCLFPLSYGLMVMGFTILLWIGMFERFAHPELTETQLFITYWKQFLLGFILLVGGFTVYPSEKN